MNNGLSKKLIGLLLAWIMVFLSTVPAVLANINLQTTDALSNEGKYFANEDFDTVPQDSESSSRPIPWLNDWDGKTASLVSEEGKLLLKHGNGTNSGGYEIQIPLRNGVRPETYLPDGKIWVDFSFSRGEKLGNLQIFLNSEGTQLMKFISIGNTVTAYSMSDTSVGLGVYEGSNTEGYRVRMLLNHEGNKNYIEKLVVNDNEVIAERAELKDGGQFSRLIFAPGSGYNLSEGDTSFSIDYLRSYFSQETILQQKLKEAEAVIDFEDICGENADVNEVSKDLDFSKMETDNGLIIVSWKSDNEAVIADDGTITEPLNDTYVTVTPILGVEDLYDEIAGADYIIAEGTPITVRVKGSSGTVEPSVPGIKYHMYETFDQPLGDPAIQPIVKLNNWSGAGESVVLDGKLQLRHKNANASGAKDYQFDIPLLPGNPGASNKLPMEENMIEFTWKLPNPEVLDAMWIYLMSGSGSTVGYTMRFNINVAGSVAIEYRDSAGAWNVFYEIDNIDVEKEHKMRIALDTTTPGEVMFTGISIDGKAEAVEPQKLQSLGTDHGFAYLAFYPRHADQATDSGTVLIEIDDLKTWKSTKSQFQALAKEESSEFLFESVKGDNLNKDAIKTDLNLVTGMTTPLYGFEVCGWESSDDTVIDSQTGQVNRPSIDQTEDAQILLTPLLLAVDPENENGTGLVQIKGNPIAVTVIRLQAAEALEAVKKSLNFADIQGENESEDHVIKDLNLISEKQGISISWEKAVYGPEGTSAKVDLQNGNIRRPQNHQQDVKVTLTAKLSYPGIESDEKEICFTVKKLEIPTQEYLNNVKNQLSFDQIKGKNKEEDQVTEHLNLITALDGADIKWISSVPQSIGIDGTVQRGHYPEPAVTVDLTAVLHYDQEDETAEKAFRLTVLPYDSENLAKGAVIKASVVGEDGSQVDMVKDGDEGTAFIVKSSLKSFSLTFDLQETKNISRIVVKELDPGVLQQMDIQYSEDSNIWYDTHRVGENKETLTADIEPITARYIRLNMKKGSGVCYLSEVGIHFQPSDTERVKADVEALEIEVPSIITTDQITLPEAGKFGSSITWSFSPSDLINDDFSIDRPKNDTRVTLKAQIQSGEAVEYKSFQRTIKGENNKTGYGGGSGGGGTAGSTGGTMPTFPNINTNLPQTTPEPSPDDNGDIFTDIDHVSWAKEDIVKLYQKGIISGKGNRLFFPDDFITREEFVKILVMVFDLDTDIAQNTKFQDVKINEWYAPYIQAAVDAGIVNGISEAIFGIGQNITREDMAVMIDRAVQAAGMAFPETPVEAFRDQQQIADYAQEAVERLARMGILNGDETRQFHPKDYATRAEAVKMLGSFVD